MSVGKICSRTTHLAEPDESARVAASRMQEHNVGTLLVIDAQRKPVGILTDRDLALRVVAAGRDPGATKVREVMTAHPRWVREDASIEDAVTTMHGLAVRRMPVVGADGRLVGIVSVDDVLELVTEELGNLGRIVARSRPGLSVPATRPFAREEPALGGPLRAASSSG